MSIISTEIIANAARWAKCEITSSRAAEVTKVAQKIFTHKSDYQAVEGATGVPWWFVGIVHSLEADLNFNCSLAQGDPWNKVSRHVPKGRGPFKSFLAAAIDALINCAPFAARWKDWSIGGVLTLFEEYNGLGYDTVHHMPSPYVFGATNQEQRGKYDSDDHWDASMWDTQIGCAALLKALMEIDNTIKFAE
jgi:lysozyme family protein